jgi:hypothetical protein
VSAPIVTDMERMDAASGTFALRVASLPVFAYLEGMEVHFTPEQETELSQIATHAGTTLSAW